MAKKGTLNRPLNHEECFGLESSLPKGKEVYEFTGSTYGCISYRGIAVSDIPDKGPFYEIPADAVWWEA